MKKKILLADDDAAIREMVGRVLESEGYGVIFARTGREAAVKFLADQPDLVILDLNMPDRDGWEAYEVMNSTHPLVPVIIITARPQQYGHAADLGVDALMEKPLHLPLLLETIARLLTETPAHRFKHVSDPNFKTMYLDVTAEKSPGEKIHGP